MVSEVTCMDHLGLICECVSVHFLGCHNFTMKANTRGHACSSKTLSCCCCHSNNANVICNTHFYGRNYIPSYSYKGCDSYNPRNKVRGGGILESPCPSVDARLGKMVQSHNCFPFTPVILKLHLQTLDESRMWPSDFQVQRSRSGHIDNWKWQG